MSSDISIPPDISPRFDPSAADSGRILESQSSLVLPGYTWEQYASLSDLFEDSGVRVRFLNSVIEIMAPLSEAHESRKCHIGYLVAQWCIEKDIPLFARGSTTLKIEGEAGGEPDESYCIGESKPVPDLTIEIALTSGGLSKRAFYRKFRVPEVWIWRDETISVFVFDFVAGDYAESDQSRVLPGIDLKAIEHCALLATVNEAVREFRARASL